MSFIPYGRQSISEADIQAVVAVLRSDFLTQGPAVPAFETALAARVGASHGVAVCNATAALHVACLALDVGPGDRVWTSPITFTASANCARYCGAQVDFVDIDPTTFNMSAEALEQKLKAARNADTLPKVVIPVHLCGQSCDMAAIQNLAQRYGFRVIEDASHAIGGHYRNGPVGDSRYSDITVFSFHPVKIITTGEGGMAVTNDPALARRMALLRSHGITRDAEEMTHAPDGPWYYQQIALGFNYRMTDIQAALGRSQLAHLDDWIAARHQIAARYDAAFESLPVVTPKNLPDSFSAYHLYVIQVENRDAVFAALRAAQIGVNVHYIPVHLQPYYRALGFQPGDFPASETYYARALSLPMFPTLVRTEQDRVINLLKIACRVS
jgi:UDP-4-amino-4,6-dideoxy-N-acetyl-beta-L-altrosamine transaminase